jgi:hypothetical protein
MGLLRAKRKSKGAQLSIDLKGEKMAGLYTEKRLYSAKEAEYHNRSPKPSTSAGAKPLPRHEGRRGRWRQARPVGTGEANGGRKPPASSPSLLAPKTKEATGPNS